MPKTAARSVLLLGSIHIFHIATTTHGRVTQAEQMQVSGPKCMGLITSTTPHFYGFQST